MAAPGQDNGEPGLWAAGEAYEPYVGRWSRLVAVEFLRRLGLPPVRVLRETRASTTQRPEPRGCPASSR